MMRIFFLCLVGAAVASACDVALTSGFFPLVLTFWLGALVTLVLARTLRP